MPLRGAALRIPPARERTATSNQTFEYDYDRFGNRWHQNAPQGGPAPQYNFDIGNHNISSGMGTDAAGNTYNDTFHSYTYDAEGRVVTVDGGMTASYTYDAFGRRASKTTGSGTVDYLYDPLGRLAVVVNPSATPVRTEIYAGSRHLGTYANNTAYFSLADWLGTERRRVDASGNPVENCNNFAFGDVQTCTQSTVSPMLFTGEEYDAETNLDPFWFRAGGPPFT